MNSAKNHSQLRRRAPRRSPSGRRAFVTGVFTLAAVAALTLGGVSCGSGPNRVTVDTKPGTSFSVALNSCKDEIRRYDARIDDQIVMCVEKDPAVAAGFAANKKSQATAPAASAASVNTASVSTPVDVPLPPSDDAGTTGGETPGPGTKVNYEPVTVPIHYTITKVDKALKINLKIAARFPRETPAVTRAWALWVLNQSCIPKMEEAASHSGADLSLAIPKVAEEDAASSADQVIAFAGPSDLTAQSFPSLPMVQWPTRAQLMPRGTQDALQTCAALTGENRDGCEREAIKKVNNPFCRDFAILVGHWLGLNRDLITAKTNCDSKAIPTVPNHSYMKDTLTAAKDSDPSFSGFSQGDLKNLLGPACKSVRLVPGSGPRATPPPVAPTATP